jgi:hypothetical protein
MAENKKVLIEIKVADKASQPLKSAEKGVFMLTQKTQQMKLADAAARGEKKRLAESQKELNYNLENAGRVTANYNETVKRGAGGQKQFKTQAGLNNAILLETGRLASDASYGFTAMANNLSQIVSLGGSFVATTGSIGSAFKELKASLFGVGGVLLGVQILIGLLQSKEFINFIKTLGGITAATRALRKALSEATDVYGAQIGKLETLSRLLEDDRITQEQRSMILKEVKKDNEDLNLQLDEQNNLTKDSVKQINARIAVLKVQAETSALISTIEKERVNQLKLENQDADEIIGWWESTTTLIANFGNAQAAAIEAVASADEQRAEGIADSQEIIDKLYEKLSLIVNFKTDKKEAKDSRDEFLREFEEGLFNIQNVIDKYNKEAEKLEVRTLDERLELEEKYAKKSATRKLEQFIEKQAKRLEEYKEEVKDAENANELIARAELDYKQSIEDAELKHGEAVLSIKEGFISKTILAKDKEAKAIAKIMRGVEDQEINSLKFSIGANEEYFDRKIAQATKDKEIADDKIANAERMKLSEVEIAQAKADSVSMQNSLLDLNYQKELSVIEAKKKISTEYIGFAQGISSLLGNIDKENEGLQKAALIIEKGAAIADIVIKTQAANAATVAADTASLGATIPVTTPLRLRNNISAGISIANILATTISSFSKPSAGGGAGATASSPVQAPAFNVVGASPTNQLAAAVGDPDNKPPLFPDGFDGVLKAYVVGSEITNQQELDRSIINTAGI